MSSLVYYKRAIQEVQERSGPIPIESRGYWFYIEDHNNEHPEEDTINLYCDIQIDPIMIIPWTQQNVYLTRYIVALQNLSHSAMRHIICLEDALMGLTTEEFKNKLIAELADDV